MGAVNGVIIYEILPFGCLNGVYTNGHPHTKGELFNEIAGKDRIESDSPSEKDSISGIYTCCWIDLNNSVENCKLEIAADHLGAYDFVWKDVASGKIRFMGKGWKTRDNQIMVRYND